MNGWNDELDDGFLASLADASFGCLFLGITKQMAEAKTEADGQMHGWINVFVFDSCIYGLSNSGFDSGINEKPTVSQLMNGL